MFARKDVSMICKQAKKCAKEKAEESEILCMRNMIMDYCKEDKEKLKVLKINCKIRANIDTKVCLFTWITLIFTMLAFLISFLGPILNNDITLIYTVMRFEIVLFILLFIEMFYILINQEKYLKILYVIEEYFEKEIEIN